MDDLRSLLKRYGHDLEKTANSALHFSVAGELISHTTYMAKVILRRICDAYEVTDPNDGMVRQARVEALLQLHRGDRSESSPSAIRHDSPRAQMDRVIRALESNSESPKVNQSDLDDPSDFEPQADQKHSDMDSESRLDPLPNWELPKIALEEVKAFMESNNEALNTFLTFVSHLVYSDPFEAVKDEVSRHSENHSGLSFATYHVRWELGLYIRKELNASVSAKNDWKVISSVLVLCGNAESGYADSCRTYMKWRWPDLTEPLFDAMQNGSSYRNRGEWRIIIFSLRDNAKYKLQLFLR